CLNNRALKVLADVGLGSLLRLLGAVPLARFLLACRGESASLPLTQSAALSRELLDQALAEHAIQAGGQLVQESEARRIAMSGGKCVIRLGQHGSWRQLSAQVVIAADGLRGGLLAEMPEWTSAIHPTSLIGAGTVLPDAAYEPGTIYMGLGEEGYVGLVKLED